METNIRLVLRLRLGTRFRLSSSHVRSLLLIALTLSIASIASLVNAEETSLDRPSILTEPTPAVRMGRDVAYLASDDMRGRGPDTGGLDRAASFIAERYKDLGLNTESFDGLPFQEFTIPGEAIASKVEKNRCQWQVGSTSVRTLELHSDFRPLSVGANRAFSGSVVFVGYGITAKKGDFSYDDYASIDARGKVVIMLRKEPQQSDANSPFDGTKSSWHALFGAKIANAKTHGAIAVVFVNDRHSAEEASRGENNVEALPGIADAGRGRPNETLPALFLSRRAFGELLEAAAPDLSLTAIEESIDRDLQPRSRDLPTVAMSGEVLLEKSTLAVKNVIATLEGVGKLAHESLVIGAHYDHVGMGGPGSLAPGIYEVHNGADDNASGTAALLEIARRLKQGFSRANEVSTTARRRLVFIAFTGEERGLLGSRHYVARPRYPLESTIAMINLDMVGRMANQQLVVYGTGSSNRWNELLDHANASTQLNLVRRVEGLGPSDHQPFFERRVPVLHFFTGLHDDYHRPSDDFPKINTDGMAGITDIVYQLASDLVVTEQRLAYVAVKGKADIRIEIDRRAKLGIRMGWNEVGSQVKIVSFTPDSAAEEAGLQIGDVIHSINGQRMLSPDMIARTIADHDHSQPVVVDVLREEKPLKFRIQLQSP